LKEFNTPVLIFAKKSDGEIPATKAFGKEFIIIVKKQMGYGVIMRF
jgi:hypothetical protein